MTVKIFDMIKYLNIKYAVACSMMFAFLILQACSDEKYDITGSTENKVFINTQSWSPIDIPNGIVYNITKTPLSTSLDNAEKIETKFVVRCTNPASSDIRVQLEYDESLILPSYSPLPGGISLVMDKNELIIPQGATVSKDSITLSAEGALELFEAGQYMAPVKVISADNASLSNQIVTSILVKSVFNNIENGATSLPGTAITRTGWTATMGGSDASNIFDGNNSSYSTGSTLPLVLEVDMQSLQDNIIGIRLQNQSRNYCMTSANVYIRESESDEYKLQGIASLSRPSNSSPYPQHIRFIGKVNARYIKLEILSFYSTTSPVRLSEFMPYREQ